MSAITIFALDVGASNIRTCGIDGDAVLFSAIIPTPPAAAVAGLIRRLRKAASGPAAYANVGLSRAAGLGDTGEIESWPSRPDWVGLPLLALLGDAFGRQPRHADDGVCAAVFEQVRGGEASVGRVLGLTIGTGLGFAVVEQGRPIQGGDGAASPAHRPYPGGMRPCRCGQRGCLQTALSARALADLGATGAEDEICDALTEAVKIASPDGAPLRIVVSGGGSVGLAGDVLTRCLTSLGAAWEFSPAPRHASLLGAALLCVDAPADARADFALRWSEALR